MGSKTRILGIAAAVAASAALFAAPAQARTSVNLSIGVPLGGYVYTQPGYAYSQPYPYVQPGYVYSQPYVYTQPSYIYYSNGGGYRHHNRHFNRGFRDRDHDGVPNRFDRRPNNPRRY
ncbi:MAG TPA: hypothetical protein VFM98_19925 [Ramlibacter sp.]|uniref:hypothetical protein n=1 Tax=Ramlibacter sp. TaxID=1917967 RepID=UPI002D7EDA49|nr:hypothetical protein [Ramlibacter sp.]HET8747879.1 hypothetical protein [Ramlibacter sp.]